MKKNVVVNPCNVPCKTEMIIISTGNLAWCANQRSKSRFMSFRITIQCFGKNRYVQSKFFFDKVEILEND